MNSSLHAHIENNKASYSRLIERGGLFTADETAEIKKVLESKDD